MMTLDEMSQLTTLYTQPHRKYHNINHINDCLAELEQYQIDHPDVRNFNLNQLNWCEKALWYHDAIYNPYSKQNEELSALLFEDANPGYLGFNVVSDTILLTAEHLKTHDFSRMDETDPEVSLVQKIVLDIDLSGFGKDRLVFAMNGMNIRHEYYRTSIRDFLDGRMGFYEALVKRPTLYYTKYFNDKYHEQSRHNIEWEMNVIKLSFKENDPSIWSDSMEHAIEKYYR